MWLQEPGSLTRIIAAMVAPRNTSSETMRPGRAASAALVELGAGAEMVAGVAMGKPSDGGDSTAREAMPQCWSVKTCPEKAWPGEGFPAAFFAGGKKLV